MGPFIRLYKYWKLNINYSIRILFLYDRGLSRALVKYIRRGPFMLLFNILYACISKIAKKSGKKREDQFYFYFNVQSICCIIGEEGDHTTGSIPEFLNHDINQTILFICCKVWSLCLVMITKKNSWIGTRGMIQLNIISFVIAI